MPILRKVDPAQLGFFPPSSELLHGDCPVLKVAPSRPNGHHAIKLHDDRHPWCTGCGQPVEAVTERQRLTLPWLQER